MSCGLEMDVNSVRHVGVPTGRHAYHRFYVSLDRDASVLAVDSLDDRQRWIFAPSVATHSHNEEVTDLGEVGRWCPQRLIAGILDEFSGCSIRTGVDPKDLGFSKRGPREMDWRQVVCPYFPEDRLPMIFLGYVKYDPEPPQVVRVRLWLEGEEVDVRLGRPVYDEPIPKTALTAVRSSPSPRKVPPLRPGATDRERMEHEDTNRRLGIED